MKKIAIAAVLLMLQGCITNGPIPGQQGSDQPPPTPEQIQLQVAQKNAAGIQTLGVATQQLAGIGALVTFVVPGSLAQRAGILPGDIFTHIELNKQMKPLTAAGLIAAVPTLYGKQKFKVVRAGRNMNIPIQFRRAPGTAPVKTAKVKKPAISVADELKKLHELKQKGAITDKEYQTQKAKVLGR